MTGLILNETLNRLLSDYIVYIFYSQDEKGQTSEHVYMDLEKLGLIKTLKKRTGIMFLKKSILIFIGT